MRFLEHENTGRGHVAGFRHAHGAASKLFMDRRGGVMYRAMGDALSAFQPAKVVRDAYRSTNSVRGFAGGLNVMFSGGPES